MTLEKVTYCTRIEEIQHLYCVYLCEDRTEKAVSLPTESECVYQMACFQSSVDKKVVKAQFIREQSRCGKSRVLYLAKVRINNGSTNKTRHQPQAGRLEGSRGTFQAWLSVHHQASYSAYIVVSSSVKPGFGVKLFPSQC